MRTRRFFGVSALLAAAGLMTAAGSAGLTAQTAPSSQGAALASTLRGGAHGTVKTSKGLPVEGLMVQLISGTTGIRTTVYTSDLGRFEFPRLDRGAYVLRIPRPLEFKPYVREGVQIDGATALPEIVVERVSPTEFLPPTAEILPQLTPAEWLANMPGTAQEKRVVLRACGIGCHGFDYPFRLKFDDASWEKLLTRMIDYGPRLMTTPQPFSYIDGEIGGTQQAEKDLIINFFKRVRSLDSELPPMKPFPRSNGPATRAVVTEYELPWALQNVHDVAGDAQGNIWFTINRVPFIGKLEPGTGKVTQYRIPNTAPPALHPRPEANIHPGLHWIDVDLQTGTVWFSWNWADAIGRLDPRTGDVQQVYTGVSGNMGLAPDGKSIWKNDGRKLQKFDTQTLLKTGKPVKEGPLKLNGSTYGNRFSRDGRYFGGGGNTVVWFDVQTEELREVPVPSGEFRKDAIHGRGDFDPEGNLWIGGKNGENIWRYNPKTGAVSEYVPPTPHVSTYSIRADKNGEVWAGLMNGGRVGRFKPRTHQWIEYVLPTSNGGFDFNSWIDNSTNPPTFWYGDQFGYIVRVQPLE